MRHLIPTALLCAAVLGLIGASRLRAQAPPTRRAPAAALPQLVGVTGKPLHSTARPYPVIRLVPTSSTFFDFDGSDDLSPHDSLIASGPITLSGSEIGAWTLSARIVDNSGLGSGLLQLTFSNGSVTVDVGLANPGGTRSRIPCRPILGGTGDFAKLTGNAGVGAEGNTLLVQLGVK